MSRSNTLESLDEPTLVQRPEMLPRAGTIEAHIMAKLAAQAREIAGFCLANRNRWVFKDDEPRRLFRYVTFHLLAGNVFVIRQTSHPVRPIIGVGFAWPDVAKEVTLREAMGLPVFDWRDPIKGGDAVVIGQVIGHRGISDGWRKLALARWPDLYQRRIFTHRKGKLVELTYAMLKRFARGGMRI